MKKFSLVSLISLLFVGMLASCATTDDSAEQDARYEAWRLQQENQQLKDKLKRKPTVVTVPRDEPEMFQPVRNSNVGDQM